MYCFVYSFYFYYYYYYYYYCHLIQIYVVSYLNKTEICIKKKQNKIYLMCNHFIFKSLLLFEYRPKALLISSVEILSLVCKNIYLSTLLMLLASSFVNYSLKTIFHNLLVFCF